MKLYEIYEDEMKYYIVTELMRGKSLCEYIAEMPKDHLTEAKVAWIMSQVLSGLNYCHMQGVAHRDIKAENLMFSDRECTILKLIDFGFAKFFKKGQTKFKEILGSPMYMAPEIVRQDQYNEKCDIWSCGILCYTMLSGSMPYKINEEDSVELLFELIKSKKFSKDDFLRPEWNHISDEAKNFTLSLLQSDPKMRKSAADALNDPWIILAKDKSSDQIEFRKTLERLININVRNLIIAIR